MGTVTATAVARWHHIQNITVPLYNRWDTSVVCAVRVNTADVNSHPDTAENSKYEWQRWFGSEIDILMDCLGLCFTVWNFSAIHRLLKPHHACIAVIRIGNKICWSHKSLNAPVSHDDVIKCTHFPRYWPFVRGIHRSPANSPHKCQWRGALMFSLICVYINGWVNNREAGDLRRYRAHYDVTVMISHNAPF